MSTLLKVPKEANAWMIDAALTYAEANGIEIEKADIRGIYYAMVSNYPQAVSKPQGLGCFCDEVDCPSCSKVNA